MVGYTPVVAWPAHDDMISQVEVDQDLLSGRIMKWVDPDEESGDQVSLVAVPAVDRDACHTKLRETVVDDVVMEKKFVLVPEVCPIVSMTSVSEPTFRPALSEVYSPVVLAGGGGLPRHTPWQWWSRIQRECLSCRLSEASFRPFLWGRSPWMWSV